MPRISFRLPVLLATPVHCLQQREISWRLSISSSTMAVAYLICTTIIWLHCWKCYSCILRPYRFNYWMPSLNPPTHTPPTPARPPRKNTWNQPRGCLGGRGSCFVPRFRLAPFSDLSLKGVGGGLRVPPVLTWDAKGERKSPTFIRLFSSSLFFSFFSSLSLFLAVNVSSESLFTKNEKKEKNTSFIGLGPCIPLSFFPFKKSFLFCFWFINKVPYLCTTEHNSNKK